MNEILWIITKHKDEKQNNRRTEDLEKISVLTVFDIFQDDELD